MPSSETYSACREPLNYLLTGHGTVQLIWYQVNECPGKKSLSLPEQKAMEEYIEEALQQGYIHSSTSPAASNFFFVAKKDEVLWTCIDYRAQNNITVKFQYPLPLVPAALDFPFSSPNWTSAAHRTSSGYVRGTSGRRRL